MLKKMFKKALKEKKVDNVMFDRDALCPKNLDSRHVECVCVDVRVK